MNPSPALVSLIPVQLSLPDSYLPPLSQFRHAKKATDDEVASACVQFCIRLLLDTQVETDSDTPLLDDLHRALLDVRAERRTLLDLLSGGEKSLADARAIIAALKTRQAHESSQ